MVLLVFFFGFFLFVFFFLFCFVLFFVFFLVIWKGYTCKKKIIIIKKKFRLLNIDKAFENNTLLSDQK